MVLAWGSGEASGFTSTVLLISETPHQKILRAKKTPKTPTQKFLRPTQDTINTQLHTREIAYYMKRKTLIATGILLLTVVVGLYACEQLEKPAADGYYFGEPQYVNANVSVQIVTYTEKDFIEEVRKRKLPKEVMAFTELFSNDQQRCRIHIVRPTEKYSPEMVGHEFLHCVYGQWHTSNEDFE